MKMSLLLLCALMAAACSEEAAPSAAAEKAEGAAGSPPGESNAEVGRSITPSGYRGIRIGEAPGGAAGALGFSYEGDPHEPCQIWESEGAPGLYLLVENNGSGPVVNRISARTAASASAHTPEGIEVGSPGRGGSRYLFTSHRRTAQVRSAACKEPVLSTKGQ